MTGYSLKCHIFFIYFHIFFISILNRSIHVIDKEQLIFSRTVFLIVRVYACLMAISSAYAHCTVVNLLKILFCVYANEMNDMQ